MEVKKKLSNSQDPNAYTSTSSFKALYPFFISMKLLGLFHSKNYQIKCEDDSSKSRTIHCRLQLYPSQIFSVVILSLIIGNTLRIFNSLSTVELKYGPETFERIMLIAFYVLCACNTVICFKMSHQHCLLPKFFLLWDEISKGDKKSYCPVISRKMAYTCTSVCWFLVIVNVVASACSQYLTNTVESTLTPFTKNSSHVNIIIGVYLILHVYVSATWIFPMGLYYIICTILFKEFKRFNTNLSQLLHKDEQFLGKFEEMRQKHGQLCHLVASADGMLSVYNAVILVLSVCNLCLFVYNVIWYDEVRNNGLVTATYLFWMLGAIVNLAMICGGSAFVNEQVITGVIF